MKLKFTILYIFLLIVIFKTIILKDVDYKELDALIKDPKQSSSDDLLKDSKTNNFLNGSNDLLIDVGLKSSVDDLLKGSPDDLLKSLGSQDDLFKDIVPTKGKDFEEI